MHVYRLLVHREGSPFGVNTLHTQGRAPTQIILFIGTTLCEFLSSNGLSMKKKGKDYSGAKFSIQSLYPWTKLTRRNERHFIIKICTYIITLNKKTCDLWNLISSLSPLDCLTKQRHQYLQGKFPHLNDLDHVKIERETTHIFKLLNLSLSPLNYLRNQGKNINKELIKNLYDKFSTFILSIWYRVVNGRETSQTFKLIRSD